ncbi:MAG TPA: HRDC domain-containing protein [Gemmatimonadaceae bacterium]|nr:HRDC domain-containing protein [Gemmatimonadaceae bacterium]
MPVRSETHTPVYLDTPAGADRFLASIEDAPVLAVDTEGASFHRFVDRVYLLQLSTASVTALFDPLTVGPLDRLGRMLADRAAEVVFHDADYDLRLLHQDYGWHPTHLFDTRVAAQLLGIRVFGLAALLQRYLGLKLDKKHQRADWSMRPLPPDMRDYAAQDTMHLLELRDALARDLEGAGRWSWAEEEFARIEGTRWENGDASDAFLRIKGARDLTRRQLAILRELVLWRDDVAREKDRATFRVAGNEALLETARRAPRTREDLAAIKGMPRGMAERQGEALLAAIERGLAVADDKLPRFPRAPRWDRDPDFEQRVNRLREVRERVARELDLDPGFLISRERLEVVARRKPASLEDLRAIPEIRNWQVDVMGDELLVAGGW